MVDESSLASTKQVRDFLRKLDPSDRVLFIGDMRQHQGVEAGKPFEQLVNAGMKTVKLDQIVRQRDPELLRAVEHLSRGEVAEGIALLELQGRVTSLQIQRQSANSLSCSMPGPILRRTPSCQRAFRFQPLSVTTRQTGPLLSSRAQ